MKYLPLLLALLFVPLVSGLEVTINSPTNTTYNNYTFLVNVSINESTVNGTWQYSLDGASNVTFTNDTSTTANFSINVTNDAHVLVVWVNDSGGVWNQSNVSFTASYLQVECLDEETGANCGAGILIKIINPTTLATISQFYTDVNGTAHCDNLSLGTYKITSGLTGTNYPYLRTKTVSFASANTDVTHKLVRIGTGQFVTYQIIDSYYRTSVINATVDWFSQGGVDAYDEQTTDGNGFVTEYVRVGVSYLTTIQKTGYTTANVTQSISLSLYSIAIVRTSLNLREGQKVYTYLYPNKNVLNTNATVSFSLDIYDSSLSLIEYGIVASYDPDILIDDSFPFDNINKMSLATGSNSSGGFISTPVLDLDSWNSDEIYIGFYYTQSGQSRQWSTRKYTIIENSDVSPSFFDFKQGVYYVVYGLGFGELALQIVFFGIVTYLSMLASNFAGSGFGIIMFLGVLIFFIGMGMLPPWMAILAILSIAGIARYRGGMGGQEV